MNDAKHFNGQPAMASCGIAIMAKASAPGQTKTRLVPPLTFDEAAALNTAFLQDIADNVLRARVSLRDRRLCCIRAARLALVVSQLATSISACAGPQGVSAR